MQGNSDQRSWARTWSMARYVSRSGSLERYLSAHWSRRTTRLAVCQNNGFYERIATVTRYLKIKQNNKSNHSNCTVESISTLSPREKLAIHLVSSLLTVETWLKRPGTRRWNEGVEDELFGQVPSKTKQSQAYQALHAFGPSYSVNKNLTKDRIVCSTCRSQQKPASVRWGLSIDWHLLNV